VPGLTQSVPGDFIYDDAGKAIASIRREGILAANPDWPIALSRSRVVPVDHTEPVAANGEFMVDDTDVVLPGFGVPSYSHDTIAAASIFNLRWAMAGITPLVADWSSWLAAIPADPASAMPNMTHRIISTTRLNRIPIRLRFHERRWQHRGLRLRRAGSKASTLSKHPQSRPGVDIG